MTNAPTELLRGLVILARVGQVGLVAIAGILALGSLQMPVIYLASISVFALVLLGFAGVLQGVIRVLRGWAE